MSSFPVEMSLKLDIEVYEASQSLNCRNLDAKYEDIQYLPMRLCRIVIISLHRTTENTKEFNWGSTITHHYSSIEW